MHTTNVLGYLSPAGLSFQETLRVLRLPLRTRGSENFCFFSEDIICIFLSRQGIAHSHLNSACVGLPTNLDAETLH